MERLLTKKEVADLMHVSERTIDRLRARCSAEGMDVGEVRLCKVVRFRPEKIEDILKHPERYRV
jgi:hypothetical protein